MTTLNLPQPLCSAARLDNDLATLDRAREYADASRAEATNRAYAADWRDFTAYCDARGVQALPATPQTVVQYVTDLAERSKLATIRRRLAGIAQTHKERGLESPTTHEMLRRVLRGIARTLGSAQAKKSAVTLDHLRAMLLEIPGDGLKARRDRALLLLGFGAALRRSELAALNVEDLAWTRNGLRVTIRRSKTDQTGQGADVPIPFVADRALCAARAVREWLDSSRITSGPVFRTFTLSRDVTDRRIDGNDVARLVKSLAVKAQLDGDFSAHSLRAGFCTTASQAHVSLDRIATVTRHRSFTVLAGYVRRANLFEDPILSSIIAPQAQKANQL